MPPYVPPHKRVARGSGVLPTPSTSPISSPLSTPPSSPPLTLPPSPPPSPIRRRRALAGDWRRDAGAKSASPEFVVGLVVLLPAEDQVPADSIVRKHVSGSPWNHPVVITQTWEERGVKFVSLRMCTSWGGEGIARKQERHRHYYVEADKSHLIDGSDEFFKQTWVNCSPGSDLTIEFEHLHFHTGKGKGDIQFSHDALDEFNKHERTPRIRRDSFFE